MLVWVFFSSPYFDWIQLIWNTFDFNEMAKHWYQLAYKNAFKTIKPETNEKLKIKESSNHPLSFKKQYLSNKHMNRARGSTHTYKRYLSRPVVVNSNLKCWSLVSCPPNPLNPTINRCVCGVFHFCLYP